MSSELFENDWDELKRTYLDVLEKILEDKILEGNTHGNTTNPFANNSYNDAYG